MQPTWCSAGGPTATLFAADHAVPWPLTFAVQPLSPPHLGRCAPAAVQCGGSRCSPRASFPRPAPGGWPLPFHRVPNCYVVGLDVTHQCCMTAAQIDGLEGRGRHGTFLRSISQFYLDYHRWGRVPPSTRSQLQVIMSFNYMLFVSCFR